MARLSFTTFAARFIRAFAIRQYRIYGKKANSLKLRLRSILGDEKEQSKEYARMVSRRWRTNNPEKVNIGSVHDVAKESEQHKKWRLEHKEECNLWAMLWKRERMKDPVFRAHLTKYNREYKQWTRAVAKQKAMEAQCSITAPKEQDNVQEH
jgi:hypothetical protein